MSIPYLLNPNANEFHCECGRVFSRKFDYSRHVKTTHGVAIQCLLCKKYLKSGYRKDMRVRHLLKGCNGFKSMFGTSDEKIDRSVAKLKANECFDMPLVNDGNLEISQ